MKALILMTRIPIPGKTKTRLMEILSGKQCADIHRCFLLDLFYVFSMLEKDIDIFLTYTPDDAIQIIDNILPKDIACFPQKGTKLGEKMANAIEELLRKGYKKVLLMGSDIPEIQPQHIQEAYSVLENNDICLGPTFDGGYYLVGMKKIHREIFNDSLKWGNKSVLEGTIDIINGLGLQVGLIEKHRDIDTKEDLAALTKKINLGVFQNKIAPQHTIQFIKNCWSDENYAKKQAKV
ncbi:TIGR04282 family arsenosugar biosynthesis glycosyltransferase [Natronincola ferrireducens]|uniref:Glycosyltransferase n=1 Tax=Natronincola ferrireducens TaxID=393762 RepID=A0A1G9EHT8_9FIRM|nr:TIGR04282 family arsenosugar biosynthesis glycosyltransferase [Natronincola ferrireducens]SDK75621.1 hypothetical protein SAMN05660472_01975 [Natronincola ferrireducens]